MAAESQEIKVSHEKVEGFVNKLREFHLSLDVDERAMLLTVIESAQDKDTMAYGPLPGYRYREGASEGWEELVGWIEEQSEEDTQGFMARCATCGG